MLVLRFAEPSHSAARGVQFNAKCLTQDEAAETKEKKFIECDRSELLSNFLHQTQGTDDRSRFGGMFPFLGLGTLKTEPSLSPIVTQSSVLSLDARACVPDLFACLEEYSNPCVTPPYVEDLTALQQLPHTGLRCNANLSTPTLSLYSGSDSSTNFPPSPISQELVLPSSTTIKSNVAYRKASKKKRKKKEWKFHMVQPEGSHHVPAEHEMIENDADSLGSWASQYPRSDSDYASNRSLDSTQGITEHSHVAETPTGFTHNVVSEEKPYMKVLQNGKPSFLAYKKYWLRELKVRYPSISQRSLTHSIALKYQEEFP
jgi:hypothetical protein